MKATVIVPFHANLGQLTKSVAAARSSMPDAEIVIAADGAHEDCGPVARAHQARVIDVPGPVGPATARNRAAAQASGEILLFVDADVVVDAHALPGLYRALEETPELSGVFGAYDWAPAERNFMSQYKNLSHAYVHEIGNPDAQTFWAGLGAIRANAFWSVGGFDERFRRPSVEDIELGYRLTIAGHRLRLDPSFRGCHLKRWTLRSSVVTDIRARGVPWTQLIHRCRMLRNDLNTSFSLRISVLLAYAVVTAMALVAVSRWAVAGAIFALLCLLTFNASYYRWFARRRGWWFAIRVVPAHILHHLCNGISFAAGTALYLAGQAGWRLPGVLPTVPWSSGTANPVSNGSTAA